MKWTDQVMNRTNLRSFLSSQIGSSTGVIGFAIDSPDGDRVSTVDIFVEESRRSLQLPEFPTDLALEFRYVRLAPFFRPLATVPPFPTRSGVVPGNSVQAVANDNGYLIPGTWGTIGAFVQSGEQRWLVSANHVLSENGTLSPMDPRDPRQGVTLVQPRRRLSTSVQYVRIAPSGNRADIAAALLTESAAADIQPSYNPALASGKPYVVPPSTELEVIVYGSNGNRSGRLLKARFDGFVTQRFDPYEPSYIGQLLLKGEVDDFVSNGDSGSLVAAKVGSDWLPIGVIFAKSESGYAIATPLDSALSDLSTAIGSSVTEILI